MQRDAICPAVWAIFAVLLLSTPLAAQPVAPQGPVSPTDLAQIKSPVDLQKLIEKQVAAGNLDQAKKTLEDARIRFSTRAFLPVLGPCYELVGMKSKALKFHAQFNQLFPGNLLAMRNLANFYISNGDARNGVALAGQMLKVEAPTDAESEKLVSWARQRWAVAMASTREVAKIDEALALIAENGGLESADEDSIIRARLLAMMPDAANRDKAIQFLVKEIGRKSPAVKPNDHVLLASLYERSGDWPRARETIQNRLDVKLEKPSPTEIKERLFFANFMIDMLILNGHPNDTDKYLKIIEKHNTDLARLLPLRAITWSKQGKVPKATRLLTDAARDAWPPNTPEKLAKIKRISLLFVQIERFAEAKAMLRAYVRIAPQDELILAHFLGLHGDLDELDEALNICKKVAEARPRDRPAALQTALSFLGSRRNESTKPQIDRVAKWAAPLLDGDSSVVVRRALADARGDYEAVAQAYREILNQPSLKGSGTSAEAGYLNDLAFVLGHRLGHGNKARCDEALRYSNQAIEILGERRELLDTRAMIHLAAPGGRVDQALRDMEKALKDRLPGRQASMHFHMAMIQKSAGNPKLAVEQLRLAIDEGLKIGQLSTREAKVFNELSGRLPSRDK